MVCVTADLCLFVSSFDEVLGDLDEVVDRGEVQAGVAFVLEVWVLEEVRVVADDALDEEDVVEEDGSPEASGRFNPGVRVSDLLCLEGVRSLYIAASCCSRVVDAT